MKSSGYFWTVQKPRDHLGALLHANFEGVLPPGSRFDLNKATDLSMDFPLEIAIQSSFILCVGELCC